MTGATVTTYLVIDDDDAFRATLTRALVRRGASVVGAATRAEAVRAMQEHGPFDRAVVDLRMPGGSGLEVLREIAVSSPSTRSVVLTGFGSIATAVECLRRGAHHYLCKPVAADEVIAAFDDPPSADAVAIPEPSLARVEWEHIQRVLKHTDNNISEAARRLGLHRRTLQRKLAKFPMPR